MVIWVFNLKRYEGAATFEHHLLFTHALLYPCRSVCLPRGLSVLLAW